MSRLVGYFAGWKIRNLLFLLLLLSGIVPLAISSLLMMQAERRDSGDPGEGLPGALGALPFGRAQRLPGETVAATSSSSAGLVGDRFQSGPRTHDGRHTSATLRNEWLQSPTWRSTCPKGRVGWLCRALDSAAVSGTYAMAGDLDPSGHHAR